MAQWAPRSTVGGPLLGALAVGVVVTGTVAVVPGARFAYDNPSLHVALETAEGLIAGLLAYLAVGRLRVTAAARDLHLAIAFASFAVANLVVSAAPAVALQERPGGFLTWLALLLRLVGAGWFLRAATGSPDAVDVDRALLRRVVAGAAVVAAAVLLLAGAADLWLADGLQEGITPASSNRPRFVGHPLLLGAQLVSAACFTAAAVLFDRRAASSEDDLLRWLAGGAALSAAARLNYCLFPSLYSQWVYVGDVLRLGAYLLFLVGAAREITTYWRDRAEAAVAGERRRIARELHDGLAQELSFIRSQTAAMANGAAAPGMEVPLHAAAERALAESRRAVDVLAERGPVPVVEAVVRAAEEVAGRAGVEVRHVGPGGIVAGDAALQVLVRVTREASSNAVRHGGATTVTVSLDAGEGGVCLRVADDGAGFDTASATRGFGLQSMRERVLGAGGRFELRSAPQAGTEVEVWLPR